MNIGIDVGASHISTAIVNDKGDIVFRLPPVLNRNKMKNDFTSLLKYCINEISSKVNNIDNIGISLPGNCKDGILIDAPNIGIKNVNIINDLKDISHQIHIENDAVCALIAERTFGVLKDYPNSLILTFGTDIGYAVSFFKQNNFFISSDETRDNLNKFNKGFDMRCLSLRELHHNYRDNIKKDINRYDIFNDIEDGNEFAIELFNKYIHNNCIGIKRLCNKLNIDTICIGGGLSEHCSLFLDKMRQDLPGINVFVSKYKNESGIVGATLLPYNERKIDIEIL